MCQSFEAAFLIGRKWLIYREDLKPTITYCEPCSHFCHSMLATPTHDRLVRSLRYMLDENEFLSSYGLRSVSRVHRDKPYVFVAGHEEHRVDYVPGERTKLGRGLPDEGEV